MFGYIKPLSAELKVKENELYKAFYCGLCREMGGRTGCLHRFSLSYDFVFFAIVRNALEDSPISLSSGRCMAHPIKKRAFVEQSHSLSLASDMSALLLYYDIKDDISDSSGFKKLFSYLALPLAYSIKKRAKGYYEIEEEIVKKLNKLSELEKSKNDSVDYPAHIFGSLLADIVSIGLDGKALTIAKESAVHTGKWLYITDAFDDLEKDEKNHSYNPFLSLYGSAANARKHAESVSCSLYYELDRIAGAFDFLSFSDEGVKNIISNIVFYGMPNEIERILKSK